MAGLAALNATFPRLVNLFKAGIHQQSTSFEVEFYGEKPDLREERFQISRRHRSPHICKGQRKRTG